MPTIADAHRNYALGVVVAGVGRELALLYGKPTDAHDVAIADAQVHVDELTAIEPPPADVQDHVDQEMQAARNTVEAALTAWSVVENGDAEAQYVYPSQWATAQRVPGIATANRQQAEFYLSAIDAVWTSGGGN